MIVSNGLVGAAILAIAAVPAAAAPATDASAETIRGIEADLVAAARARDVDRLAAHYAADAEIRSPGEDIQGRAALLAHLEPLKTATRLEINRNPDRIAVSTNIAYVSGHYDNVYQGAGSGRVDIEKGTYLAVYQRDPDGRWRIRIDMTAPAPR